MRHLETVSTPCVAVFAALLAYGSALLGPSHAQASDPRPATRALSPLPPAAQLPDFRASLDDADEIAALDAIHVALTQVGDGGSYVWHRNHGRLSGVFQPTQSFKDGSGQVCRHLVVMLVAGTAVRKTEGIACRLANGRWQLDG